MVPLAGKFAKFYGKTSIFAASKSYFCTFYGIRTEKVRKRQWLPTSYFYITTVVINEKKRSFDVLCIEIIVNVQN